MLIYLLNLVHFKWINNKIEQKQIGFSKVKKQITESTNPIDKSNSTDSSEKQFGSFKRRVQKGNTLEVYQKSPDGLRTPYMLKQLVNFMLI